MSSTSSSSLPETNSVEQIILRSFADPINAKGNRWDKIISIDGRKFYVLGGHLANYAAYFDDLFYGASKDDVEYPLPEVDPHVFQSFLEVIHGESAVDDDNASKMLELARRFEAPIVTRRVEHFLTTESGLRNTCQWEMAMEYNLQILKKSIVEKIPSLKALKSLLPKEIDDLDKDTMQLLFKKRLEFGDKEEKRRTLYGSGPSSLISAECF